MPLPINDVHVSVFIKHFSLDADFALKYTHRASLRHERIDII